MFLASCLLEGGLSGTRKKFPFTIKKVKGLTYEYLQIKSQDELIGLISDEQERQKTTKKKLAQIIDECGVSPIDLTDNRTLQLFEIWNYYRYAPHKIKSEPFYDANGIFNMTLGQRIG